MQHIISSVNTLKDKFNGKDICNLNILSEISDGLGADNLLSNNVVVNALTCDIKEYVNNNGNARFNNTKSIINNEESSFVFSLFSAPYYKDISIDCFTYRKISVPSKLKKEIYSPALPVSFITSSKGFSSDTVVALFPENHVDGIQLPEDKIFYFMDRFVKRFYNYSKPSLNQVMQTQLCKLRVANETEIIKASSCWVYLHEYFHRQGSMPIPEYLSVKSLKALAGLEELRVDLLSILTCVEKPYLFDDAPFLAEFILVERLIRYGVECREKLSYDAISSQLLFCYLLEYGGISIINNQLILNQCIFDRLKSLSLKIDNIESNIHTNSLVQVKQELLNFVHKYVYYDSHKKAYCHHQLFKSLFFGA